MFYWRESPQEGLQFLSQHKIFLYHILSQSTVKVFEAVSKSQSV